MMNSANFRQLEILNDRLIAAQSAVDGQNLLMLVLAVLLVILLVALLAVYNRKSYYRAENEKNAALVGQYYQTIQKNAKRITQLKEIRDRFKAKREAAMREAYEAQKNNITLSSELASHRETIRDYETIISLKDEELNEYDSLHQDARIQESTKLIDRLRDEVLYKCRELKKLKAYMIAHGIAPAAVLLEPDMSVEGAPYFSQIAEPDPDNNRPEIDGCEVCEAEQPESPALECDVQDVAGGC